MAADTGRGPVDALHAGRAYVDLTRWRKIEVSGVDASAWLNDLLSADLEGLRPGEARRSLLLTPTGRIRADVSVMGRDHSFLLVQDPEQSSAIDQLLAPYMLSSNITLMDRTGDLALLAFPGASAPSVSGAFTSSPSVLGTGEDLLAPVERLDDLRAGADGLEEAGPRAVEAWRVELGIPRVGIDLGADSLPHETDLGSAVAYTKGCFLGQEAVARVRNLGHPAFVIAAVEAAEAVAAGDPVSGPGGEVGRITSATLAASGRTAVIVRVKWAARDSELRTGSGVALEARASVAD